DPAARSGDGDDRALQPRRRGRPGGGAGDGRGRLRDQALLASRDRGPRPRRTAAGGGRPPGGGRRAPPGPPRGGAPAAAPGRGQVPLTVDEATRRATVHGRLMDLTRVEFDLLACLLGAPGRVFTRAQLIDRVWGDGFAITDRTVDSHVKGLRRKVAEAGGDA